MASNRRKFLKLTAAGAAGAAALAACGAPATPTAAPAPAVKPTEAPKAAAPTTAPAAAPTTAPAAAAPTAKPAAAAPTAAPAAGAPTAAAKPTEAAKAGEAGQTVSGGLKSVPRNRTFIAVRGGQQGKFVEWDQWNPFVPVREPPVRRRPAVRAARLLQRVRRQGVHVARRELQVLRRLQELTIKTRHGINWSDGKPTSPPTT